jgi:hypothetical protein
LFHDYGDKPSNERQFKVRSSGRMDHGHDPTNERKKVDEQEKQDGKTG